MVKVSIIETLGKVPPLEDKVAVTTLRNRHIYL